MCSFMYHVLLLMVMFSLLRVSVSIRPTPVTLPRTTLRPNTISGKLSKKIGNEKSGLVSKWTTLKSFFLSLIDPAYAEDLRDRRTMSSKFGKTANELSINSSPRTGGVGLNTYQSKSFSSLGCGSASS